MAKRILFVDDEPMLLSGLQRSLRLMRTEWEMVFAPGGNEALAAMDQQTFDIIVTDMRMPGMDGAQLLEEVQKRSPQTLRMENFRFRFFGTTPGQQPAQQQILDLLDRGQ